MYLIAASLLVLAVYISLLAIEARREARFFESWRAALDRAVRRGAFIIAHVDFASFAREQSRVLARRTAHDFVHVSLGAVRAVERLLTKAVRRLRMHPEFVRPTNESSRTFVRTLSEFKGHLESSRPNLPEAR
jgi:hypothetical protein